MNLQITYILEKLGIPALNPMQEEMLRIFDDNKNILLLSPTGSGKTLAFLLPLVSIFEPGIRKVQSMILVPSRELALQIETVFKSMKTEFKVNACYGGHSLKIERNNLQSPPALLVGTPGRIADHLEKQTFETDSIRTIIFDEFDKSLEFGFLNEMEYILKRIPKNERRILTSATQAIEIPPFAGVQNPLCLNFLKDQNQSENLTIKIIHSKDVDKLDTFLDLLGTFDNHAPTIVFCNHREVVEQISERLSQNMIVNECFHGKMDQDDRERVLAKFRNGSVNVLITTDLASRGLDISSIKNIIHYQQPHSEEIFIHRNGRTARMQSSGNAYLILTDKEKKPEYISQDIEVIEPESFNKLPATPEWVTLFISKGKKDKINKMDIVGFLSKVGKLEKDELGIIEVKDFFAYAAVKRDKIDAVLKLVKDQKIKNRAVKIIIV